MSKWKKILGGLLIFLVVLVGVLLALANYLITPERVRQTILPLAEQHLNRKLSLGDIKVSLFSGIEIQGLTVYEPDGQTIFVATDLVRLRYQLLPLLAMKVVVDEVRLEKPSIRVVRLKDGRFNFSDLTGDASADGAVADAGAKPASEGSGTPISLLVSELLLQDGTLVFFDHVLNNAVPYRYEITNLQAAAKGVTLTAEVPVSLQCQLNGSRLALEGRMRLLPFGGAFDVELLGFDVMAFNHYFQDAVPGTLRGLKVDLKSSLAGDLDRLEVDGTLKASDIDLLLSALPDAPLTGATLAVDYDLNLGLQEDSLVIDALKLDFNGIKAEVSGKVAALRKQPVVELQAALPRLDLRQALHAVPSAMVKDLAGFDASGSVMIDARLQGGIDKPKALLESAVIVLENVQATAGGQRPAVDGRLRLTGGQVVSEDLHVRLGENRADIVLKVNDLFASPMVASADVSSERFLIDPLLQGGAGAAAAAGGTEKKGASGAASAATEIGPFDIPLQASGNITLGETVYKGLAVREFVAQYELKGNVLTLKRMDGQVAGGSFSNTARVDLGKPGLAYSARLGLKAIQADPLLTAFAPKTAGTLFGAMDMNFALEGQGTVWKTLSRKLNGEGEMLVADGRLVSPALVEGLSSFLQLPELNDIRFNTFRNTFKVVDGRVNLDSRILSSTLKLFPKGTVGLDGSLNLALDTRLSPELSARLDRKGQVAGYLVDDEGWSRLPLLVTGTVDAPRFGLDPKGVKEQATKALGGEIGRQLDKLLGGDKNAPAEQGKEPAEGTAPAADPAQQLLKKLFGN